MASSQETQQTQGVDVDDHTDQPPLWAYVTKLEKIGTTGSLFAIFAVKLDKDHTQGLEHI